MKKFLTNLEIQKICSDIGDRLNQEIEQLPEDREIVFICTLKGAFPFFNMVTGYLSDKVRQRIEIEFIQPTSFEKNERKEVKFKGFDFNINHKDIYIFEDILDSYKTIESILEKIDDDFSITVVSLFAKPTQSIWTEVRFIEGKQIPEDIGFLVGFGLDDDQKGRLLLDIYIK